jgi:hypothetical protein
MTLEEIKAKSPKLERLELNRYGETSVTLRYAGYEIEIGYTLLTALVKHIRIDQHTVHFADMARLIKALDTLANAIHQGYTEEWEPGILQRYADQGLFERASFDYLQDDPR